MRLEEPIVELVEIWKNLVTKTKVKGRSSRVSTSSSNSDSVVPISMVAQGLPRSSTSTSSELLLSSTSASKFAIPSPSELLLPSSSRLTVGDTVPLFICAYDTFREGMTWYAVDIVCNHSNFTLPCSTNFGLRDSFASFGHEDSTKHGVEKCYTTHGGGDSSGGSRSEDSSDTSGLKNSPPQCWHMRKNCLIGSLAPIVSVDEDTNANQSWAVLGDDKLYRIASSINYPYLKNWMTEDVSCFDLSKGSWYPCAPMSFKRTRPHTWALGGKIYVLGGVLDDSTKALCEVYDPKVEKWITLPDPTCSREPHVYNDMFTAASVERLGDSMFIYVGFISRGELYLLDLSENRWISLGNDHDFKGCYGTQITAVGFTLFWFSRESFLCAYDIPTRTRARSLDTICSLLFPQCPIDPYFGTEPSLIHIGQDMFCYLYIRPPYDDRSELDPPIQLSRGPVSRYRQLHCFKFRATFAEPFLHISSVSCQSYVVEADVFLNAAVVRHELVMKFGMLC